MDAASPVARMFLQELSATFYSEYDARTGDFIFYDKFQDGCIVKFVIFIPGENNIMYISDIETRGKGCQRKGYGRKVMKTLIAKSDMFDITLELDVAPYSESISLDDLYSFYISLGFKPAAIDDHPYRMRRLPNGR